MEVLIKELVKTKELVLYNLRRLSIKVPHYWHWKGYMNYWEEDNICKINSIVIDGGDSSELNLENK